MRRPARRGSRLRAAALARDRQLDEHRALRVRRRHQPAPDRLGAAARPARRAGDLRQCRRARRVPARLPQRVREVHRPAAARRRRRERRACCRRIDAPEKKDLGRNGTYLVLRQLRQDVRGFWRFIYRASRRRSRRGRQARGRPGRTHEGGRPAGADRAGARFPASLDAGGSSPEPVHVRPRPGGRRAARSARTSAARTRATRTTPDARPGSPVSSPTLGFGRRVFRDDLMSAVRFHRILRRGREFGPGLSPEDALAPAPTGRAGARPALHLPEREHLTPVRVPAERLDHEHQVLRI